MNIISKIQKAGSCSAATNCILALVAGYDKNLFNFSSSTLLTFLKLASFKSPIANCLLILNDCNQEITYSPDLLFKNLIDLNCVKKTLKKSLKLKKECEIDVLNIENYCKKIYLDEKLINLCCSCFGKQILSIPEYYFDKFRKNLTQELGESFCQMSLNVHLYQLSKQQIKYESLKDSKDLEKIKKHKFEYVKQLMKTSNIYLITNSFEEFANCLFKSAKLCKSELSNESSAKNFQLSSFYTAVILKQNEFEKQFIFIMKHLLSVIHYATFMKTNFNDKIIDAFIQEELSNILNANFPLNDRIVVYCVKNINKANCKVDVPYLKCKYWLAQIKFSQAQGIELPVKYIKLLRKDIEKLPLNPNDIAGFQIFITFCELYLACMKRNIPEFIETKKSMNKYFQFILKHVIPNLHIKIEIPAILDTILSYYSLCADIFLENNYHDTMVPILKLGIRYNSDIAYLLLSKYVYLGYESTIAENNIKKDKLLSFKYAELACKYVSNKGYVTAIFLWLAEQYVYNEQIIHKEENKDLALQCINKAIDGYISFPNDVYIGECYYLKSLIMEYKNNGVINKEIYELLLKASNAMSISANIKLALLHMDILKDNFKLDNVTCDLQTSLMYLDKIKIVKSILHPKQYLKETDDLSYLYFKLSLMFIKENKTDKAKECIKKSLKYDKKRIDSLLVLVDIKFYSFVNEIIKENYSYQDKKFIDKITKISEIYMSAISLSKLSQKKHHFDLLVHTCLGLLTESSDSDLFKVLFKRVNDMVNQNHEESFENFKKNSETKIEFDLFINEKFSLIFSANYNKLKFVSEYISSKLNGPYTPIEIVIILLNQIKSMKQANLYLEQYKKDWLEKNKKLEKVNGNNNGTKAQNQNTQIDRVIQNFEDLIRLKHIDISEKELEKLVSKLQGIMKVSISGGKRSVRHIKVDDLNNGKNIITTHYHKKHAGNNGCVKKAKSFQNVGRKLIKNLKRMKTV